jgi:hypothetical protein
MGVVVRVSKVLLLVSRRLCGLCGHCLMHPCSMVDVRKLVLMAEEVGHHDRTLYYEVDVADDSTVVVTID